MVYLFDLFELDDENLCLMRAGQRVPLEPRALAVLLLMVRSGGKLLKKDAILEVVWQNTVVEEGSLSRAVAVLRKQLGDDPRRPRYIETVPTFGYRFIAKVESRSDDEQGSGFSETGPAAAGTVQPAGRLLRPVRWLWPRPRWLWAAVLLSVAASMVLWRLRASRPLLPKASLVLADFNNATGEAVFDDTLRQGMIVQLEQSPELTVLSDQRIRTALRLMGQDAGVPLTPALAREVCQRTASPAVLEGSIARLGGQYVLGLRATRCGSGEVIDTEQAQARNREEVLRALDQTATRFRARIGESVISIATLDMPLEEATTSSLEALKDYSEANRIANSAGSSAAIPLLERAIALDPQFAIAHAMLGRMYGDVGQEGRSAESTAEAYRFRYRTSERERYFIVASYEMQVTGNMEKAEETCEIWGRVYPRDDGALGFPTGVILRVFGQYQAAVDMGRKLIDTDPDFAMAYHLLAVNEIALGDLTAAQALLDAATARKLEIPLYSLDRYRLAFLNDDKEAAARLAALAARQPATQDLIAAQQASALAYAGRLRESRSAAKQALALPLQSGRPELAARFEAGAALTESLFGNAGESAAHATAALNLSRGRDAVYGAAMALALTHKSTLAIALANELDKRFPEDTSARFLYVPAIRASLALNRGDPAAAVEALQVGTSYELGTPQSSFLGLYGALYPAFVRGEAYLARRRGTDAAAQFQEILDHRTLTATDPIGALAYLELGRSLALANDPMKAKASYAKFLDLWKDADVDLATLAAAKSEYSRL